MKFNSETAFTVLVVLVAFKFLDKLFLDNLVSGITGNYEGEE